MPVSGTQSINQFKTYGQINTFFKLGAVLRKVVVGKERVIQVACCEFVRCTGVC